MGLISEALLPRRPQELGRIKIGGLGALKRGSGGNDFRLPMKYDHFVVTTNHRGNDGNFARDTDIHERIGAKPLQLDGVLMFETPEENFHAEMVQYAGRTQVISCDGEEFTDLRSGNCGPCPRAEGGECPKAGKPPKCKPYGRLHLQLWASPNTLGFHVFRTTSWESTRNIQSALKELHERFGSLYQAPVRLVLYPSEDNYDDGKTSTSHKVGLVLAMSLEEAGKHMVAAGRALKSARDQLRLVSGDVQAELGSTDAAERAHFADEFFPQDEEGIRASIETEARFEDLRAELGIGDTPATIDADFEIVPEPEGDPEEEEAPDPLDEAIAVLRDLAADAEAVGKLGAAGRAAMETAIAGRDMSEINHWVDVLDMRITQAASASNGTEG